jgi:hypothetical protein
MKNKFHLLSLFALLPLFFSSCNSEDPVPENDGEVITDLTLTFQEIDISGNSVGEPFSFKASDAEGIELNATPEVDIVELQRGKTYQMKISVSNSIAGEEITPEISTESDKHQFYFLGSAFLGIDAPAKYQYNDEGGINLGLEGIVITVPNPKANTAQLQIVLRHNHNKSYPGASDPNFEKYVNAGGSSDLDITFPFAINP